MFVYLLISSLVIGIYAQTAAPKPVVEGKNVQDPRSAAPLDEQNNAKTRGLLKFHKRPYSYTPYSNGYSPYSNGYSQYSYGNPSYQQSYVDFMYAPVSAPIAPIQLPSAPVQVPVSVDPQTFFKPGFPWKPPVAPPVTPPTTPPVTPPMTPPITPPVIRRPIYVVSQQVLHQPVITEVQQIIRRPIIAELQQVVHRPAFVEYQQAFKLPTHTMHIVKKPTYSSIQQETLQKPLVFNTYPQHIVENPNSQVIQLPPQYVQSYPSDILPITSNQGPVQFPPTVVPEPPVINPLPDVPNVPWQDHLGCGSYGCSFNGVYIDPSPIYCRGADCQKKREGREIVVVPNSKFANQQMPSSSSSSTPTMNWSDSYQASKNTQDDIDSPNQEMLPLEDDVPSDIIIPKFADKLLNNPEFQQIVIGTYEEAKLIAKSIADESKVTEILKSMTDDQIKTLADKVKAKMATPDKVEGSSTTLAPVQPAADAKTESPKA